MADKTSATEKRGRKHRTVTRGEQRFLVTEQVHEETGEKTVSVDGPYTQPRILMEMAQNRQNVAQRLAEIEELNERFDFLKEMLGNTTATTAADAIKQ